MTKSRLSSSTPRASHIRGISILDAVSDRVITGVEGVKVLGEQGGRREGQEDPSLASAAGVQGDIVLLEVRAQSKESFQKF